MPVPSSPDRGRLAIVVDVEFPSATPALAKVAAFSFAPVCFLWCFSCPSMYFSRKMVFFVYFLIR
jgi:hypothetical protein